MNNLNTISADLVREIESRLNSVGIMYRIFRRVKSPESLGNKVEANPGKYGRGKKVQDIIGIRIVVYFLDDVEVVSGIIESLYRIDEGNSMIDVPTSDTFKASRYNMICRMVDDINLSSFFGSEYSDLVDESFEVQIRTILSEGWHEVDHDLRYKCSSDWTGMAGEDRALNGLLATLETTDWSLLQIFDQLSYKHFKKSNVEAMIRTKFRIRLKSKGLSKSLAEVFAGDNVALKRLFRTDRKKVFDEILCRSILPLDIDNIVLICNKVSGISGDIDNFSPTFFNVWWDNVYR